MRRILYKHVVLAEDSLPKIWVWICWDRQQRGRRKKKRITDQSKTPKIMWKTIGKNHGAAHKSTIYQRDYMREEENPHSRSVQWHS